MLSPSCLTMVSRIITIIQLLLNEVEVVFKEDDNTMMDAIPSKEEVKKRLWECNVNSSPGSDGLTYLVYKECWDVLGDALTDVCVCLHRGERETLSQRLSLMVFTPKPKKANSIKAKDKRTLSLINCDKKLYDCTIVSKHIDSNQSQISNQSPQRVSLKIS